MSDGLMHTKVLVTGATGFVGKVVCDRLRTRGLAVVTSRRTASSAPAGPRTEVSFDLAKPENLNVEELRGIDAVVHLAARVHVMDRRRDDDEYFRQFNVIATERLAQLAAAAGVRRFVFMSTIKVNGEATTGAAFKACDAPSPVGAYAMSKYLAERALGAVSARTGLSVVVIRPPLVYGPGVGGNFLRMMRLVDRGWPLPFARVRNQRSYVNVWNLADLVGRALVHPIAGGQTLLISDGTPVSTADLVRRLAAGFGKSPRLVGVPEFALRGAARILGRKDDLDRLCGSLVVDDHATRALLGWDAPVSMDEGIARTVAWYLGSR